MSFSLKICLGDLSFETLILEIFPLKFSKFLMKICSLEIFLMKIYSLEVFPWKFEIFFFLKSYLGDLSFEHLKIFKEDLFMEIFPLKYGDFCLKIHSGDFSIAILKNFTEDLFIGDFSLKNSFGDFSFDDLNIFNEDLWRFFLLKICLWRFFLEDLFWRFFHWSFENF